MKRSTGRLITPRNHNVGIPQLFLRVDPVFHPMAIELRTEETPSDVRVYKEVNGARKLIRLEAPDGTVIKRFD